MAIDPVASHASWMENFPWTRLANVTPPTEQKTMINLPELRKMNSAKARTYLGDGNYGGYYQRDDEEMFAMWQIAVEELQQIIKGL